jgi:hypothetical protein
VMMEIEVRIRVWKDWEGPFTLSRFVKGWEVRWSEVGIAGWSEP